MGKTGNRFSGSQKMSAMLSTCPYGVPENLYFLGRAEAGVALSI